MSELFSSGDIAATASSMSSTPAPSETSSAPAASPAPDPVPSASTPISADPVTPTPPAAPDPVQPTKPKGPIPFDVHSRALDNARTKEAERVRADLEQQYAWIKQQQVTPEAVQTMHDIRRQMVSDPGAFTAEYITHVINGGNPEHIRAIRAIAARVLGQRQPTAPAAPAVVDEPQPDVPLQNEHGQITGYVYSATQQAKREAWLRQQWMADVEQRIAPLQQTHQQLEQQRRDAEYDRQAQEWTTRKLGDLRKQPHFKEHEADIKQTFAARGEVPDAQVGEVLLECYLEVLTTKVLPKLSQTERAQVLGHLQHKSAASSTNPGRAQAVPAPQIPATDRDWTDLIREEWQRRSATA